MVGQINIRSLLLTALSEIVGIGWYRRRQQRKSEEWQAIQKEYQAAEKRKRDVEAAERVWRFPVKQMSQAELDQLAQGKDIDLKTCPLGTFFVCRPSELLPGVIVVGQIVRGLDMFCDQWGSGMFVPERGINRFRVEIIN